MFLMESLLFRYYLQLTEILNITKLKAVAYIGFIWVNEVINCAIHKVTLVFQNKKLSIFGIVRELS